MTERLACPSAPGPLEEFAAQFDALFGTLAQRRGFREYLQGLLSPRERNKTLTALAGAEPVVGAQHPEVQRLQFFLSESTWDADAINARRLALLLADPATVAHAAGALIIDDTGDRKGGTKTAHVARQYLGSRGKVENGIVAVSSLWADERVYYPLHVQPYTPAGRLAAGKEDPAFRTKPQIAVGLVNAAVEAGVLFRAVVADCTYGENPTFEEGLWAAKLPFVLGLKPSQGTWAPAEDAHTPQEAAQALRWGGPAEPGDWSGLERHFRDGHTESWWAAELTLGGYGPDKAVRLVVATTDPATLPAISTRYLTTNLPCPGSPRVAASPFASADLAEVVRLYALRNWVEQGYKHGKHESGWADFQVRGDAAIRRHWTLVCCAFSFCWRAWFERATSRAADGTADAAAGPESGPASLPPAVAAAAPVGGKISDRRTRRRPGFVARHAPARPRLARSLDFSLALLARMVAGAPATATPDAPPLGRRRPPARPVSPHLTKYR